MRTDENNNPTAFTTALARQSSLVEGVDWKPGTPFPPPSGLVTARLLRNPIALTVQLINELGYYTRAGFARWSYIALPKFVWDSLTFDEKRDVIGFQYQREGGTEMRHLFPNYGRL